ncbi:MAG: septal ring lytic transglycosylase RlpA family protein [Pseudomonadota bacterium]
MDFKKKIFRTAGAIALLGIAGCAQVQLVAEAVKRNQPGYLGSQDVNINGLAQGLHAETTKSLGKFKIGNPYQIKGKWYQPEDYPQYSEVGIASWYGPQFHKKRTANGGIFDMHKVSAAHKTLPLPSVVLVTNLENGRSMKILVNDRGPYESGRIIDLSKRAAQLLGFVQQGLAKVRVELLRDESLPIQAKLGRKSDTTFTAQNTKSSPQKIQFTNQQSSGNLRIKSVGTQPTQTQATQRTNSRLVVAKPESADNNQSKLFGLIDATQGNAISSVSVICCDERIISTNNTSLQHINAEGVYYVQFGAYSSIDAAQTLRQKISTLGNVEMTPIVRNDTTLYRVRLGPYHNIQESQQSLGKLLQAGFPDAQIILTKR